MAISGAWRAGLESPQPYATATVWGTGVNRVHQHYGNGSPRGVVPNVAPGIGQVPDSIIGDTVTYGYAEEDHNPLYGYGYETGTADRPSLGQSSGRGQTVPGWPEPGPHVAGLPGGIKLRSQEHGGRITSVLSKLRYPRPVSQGLDGKGTAGVLNESELPADRQLVIQTGVIQMGTARAGSQRSGSQSEYRAPIKRTPPGMRVPQYAGGERHDDMTPREQSVGRRRVFYDRQAGAPDPALMGVNSMYQSTPRDRKPPPPPDMGQAPTSTVEIVAGGYTEEDPTW